MSNNYLLPVQRNLAANLKRIRKDKRLTKRELARLCHIHEKTILRIETCRVLANVQVLDKLRFTLKVTWDELLGQADD